MNERLPLQTCQRQLSSVWLGGCAVILVLLLIQTTGGVYGELVGQAWGWFLPTVVPTLSVIIGALAYQARTPQNKRSVDSLAYSVSMKLSFFYLTLILATLLLRPYSSQTPLQFLATSDLWLGPTQGLVGLSVGAFFTSARNTD